MVAAPSLPTVGAMSRLALPLGSRLVAGALGLGRAVRWARSSSVLSPLFPVLHADEVALVDLPLVQASNPGLTGGRLVRELGRLGLAAIVVKGKLDSAASREAERSNLPLFVLPDTADVARTTRAVVRLITDREAQEEAQAAALYRYLSQGVAAGQGLSGLVGELHRLSSHSVFLADLDGKRLANAGAAPAGAVEMSLPLFVGETPVALLALRDSPDKLDEFSRVALEQGAAALALELAKVEAVEAAREGAHSDFVAALLAGDEDSALQNRARGADYPLEATQWVVLAVASVDEVGEGTVRAWLRRGAARAEALGWQARIEAEEINLPPLGLKWQATLVTAGGANDWGASRTAFLDYLIEVWPAQPPLSLAAGDPAWALDGLRRSLGQARDALLLGARLFGPGRLYLHRDMGLYRLLRHLQGTDDLQDFLENTLAALERYDKEHDTGLVETLRVLLDHGGNISATAKAMHLHRNSLVYRLDRIREIAVLDPTDPDDAFALKLALKLAPLR